METQILQIDPVKLKEARVQAGLKWTEAARMANITGPALANYESGYARPQPHVLAVLCRIYGVENPLELFSEVSDPEAFSKVVRRRVSL